MSRFGCIPRGSLRSVDAAIIASGLSDHDLRLFGPTGRPPSADFDTWRTAAVCGVTDERRNESLRTWASAPSARLANPHEDHLVPLFLAVGAAEDEPGVPIYYEPSFFAALTVSSDRFGATTDAPPARS